MSGRVELRIPLSPEQARALQALGHKPKGERPMPLHEIVRHLLHAAIDGVQRPGSWERQWLRQAYGADWEEVLEPDPAAPHRTRPKRKGFYL